MSVKRLRPVHPGEVLAHDFLEPLGLTQYRLRHPLAREVRVLKRAG